MMRLLPMVLFVSLSFAADVLADQTQQARPGAESAKAAQFSIRQLQGAWWAQEPSPTAAFAIDGDSAWFDYDNNYHPVRVDGDILIFDHGPGLGLAKSRIVSLGNGRLVLQDLDDPAQTRVYTLTEPQP